jgi:UDP-glucose 4-epimerase
MRLLITGASGFLGRNVLRRAPRDWNIVAVYHDAADFPEFVQQSRLDQVRAVRCDLANAADVRALAASAGEIDAALYLAANGDPAASARDPLRDHRLNTTTVLTFLEHCPVRHLVYLSSGAVYDGLSGPVTPALPVNPRLPYAISKLASEQYIQFFSERRGRPSTYVNVRFFGAYGPYEPLRKITTRFLTALRRGERQFAVRGDGRNLIDFMYVDDAVDGLLTLLTSVDGDRRTVDFASGRAQSVRAIVETMARATGGQVAVAFEGATEEYIEFRSADRTMAERYRFVPQIPFEVGFDQLRAFLAEHENAAVRG